MNTSDIIAEEIRPMTPREIAEYFIQEGYLAYAKPVLNAAYSEEQADLIYDELIAKNINAPSCKIITVD